MPSVTLTAHVMYTVQALTPPVSNIYRFTDIGYAIPLYKFIGYPINRTPKLINIGYPIHFMMHGCHMKGFLSFLILWIINKQTMTGAEISLELEKRKGSRPSPGTIYPVLKDLKDKGLLSIDKNKRYSLTKNGEKVLEDSINTFFQTFSDIDEMRAHCKCQHHD
jgi:DNA-binding PadR family transcriptional regulator